MINNYAQIQRLDLKKIIIVSGHYGSGKTNIAVNLAIALKNETNKVAICDLDIVNPYFRTADSVKLLEDNGVHCVIPEYANSNVDIPSIPSGLSSLLMADSRFDYSIIDVGGDEGAVVLGMYNSMITARGYDMIYVVNKYRPLTDNPRDTVDLMHDIETASRLKCSYIANNSNLGIETTKSTIDESLRYAEEICKITSLPLIFTSYIGIDALQEINNKMPFFGMINATKQLF